MVAPACDAPVIASVMRHSSSRVASSAIALVSACCISPANARGDSADFCAQLTSFSQGLARTEQREITLFADWSGPKIACRPDTNDDRSRMFCDWLVENAAIEYMEVNVWNVIGCLTGEEREPFAVGASFAGKTRFSDARLAGSHSLDVEIEYSVRRGSDPDRLHILVQQN